jgi:uncharacterized protein (TIGR00369 family)
VGGGDLAYSAHVPITPDQLGQMTPADRAEYLPDRLGIELISIEQDRVVATMPVAGNKQPHGLLHGGASAVLAETLGSLAAALHSLPERIPVGLELACTHHRSVTEGVVTGVTTTLHVGRTTSTFLIEVTDDQNRRICTAKLTCVHLDPAASA